MNNVNIPEIDMNVKRKENLFYIIHNQNKRFHWMNLNGNRNTVKYKRLESEVGAYHNVLSCLNLWNEYSDYVCNKFNEKVIR